MVAYIVPSLNVGTGSDEALTPELETLKLLRRELTKDYTVFHSVDWTRVSQGDSFYGEIDFVVVNKAGDVLVIEQKNGRLSEGSGSLIKSYTGRDKNVVDQVHRNINAVRQKLIRSPETPPRKLEYLIYLPDYRVKDFAAAGVDRERIIDSVDRKSLVPKIQKILGPGVENQEQRFQKTIDFFSHHFDAALDIHALSVDAAKVFTRLSEGLAETISCIEFSPRRLRVKGTAGCGKSLVALKRFAELAAQSKRVLMLCYTRSLRDRLNALAPKGAGLVQTWNGFCNEVLTSLGERPDFENRKLNSALWREMEEKIIAAKLGEEWKFDAVIVDEGQDFEQEWFEILQLFLKPSSECLWLEDADQNVFARPPLKLESFVTFHARKNYRTPQSIARYIKRALGTEFDCAARLEGLGVGEHQCENLEAQSRQVAQIVDSHLRQGFTYKDIIVLSMKGAGKSGLADIQAVGVHKISTFTGAYDGAGNQVFTSGDLQLESVARFKGQQCPVVILIDVPKLDSLDERQRALAFCGMTRATLRLEILYT
ncbi:MAG: NERD domain-containing protein [Rhodospirillaceae bacterium]|nr:NERD domain-containing protein [Rhodospirillaceae bacterium]